MKVPSLAHPWDVTPHEAVAIHAHFCLCPGITPVSAGWGGIAHMPEGLMKKISTYVTLQGKAALLLSSIILSGH